MNGGRIVAAELSGNNIHNERCLRVSGIESERDLAPLH